MGNKDFTDNEALSIYIACVTEIARHKRTIKMFMNPSDFYPTVKIDNLKYNQLKIDEHKFAIKEINHNLDELLKFIDISNLWKG